MKTTRSVLRRSRVALFVCGGDGGATTAGRINRPTLTRAAARTFATTSSITPATLAREAGFVTKSTAPSVNAWTVSVAPSPVSELPRPSVS